MLEKPILIKQNIDILENNTIEDINEIEFKNQKLQLNIDKENNNINNSKDSIKKFIEE